MASIRAGGGGVAEPLCIAAADVNFDAHVNEFDYSAFAYLKAAGDLRADLNGNGIVDEDNCEENQPLGWINADCSLFVYEYARATCQVGGDFVGDGDAFAIERDEVLKHVGGIPVLSQRDLTFYSDGDLKGDCVGINNRFGYGGYWFEPELGVYFVRHRVLDPKSGRWLTRDPIGYAGGWNLYEYVGGRPGEFVDPWGLQPVMYPDLGPLISGGGGESVSTPMPPPSEVRPLFTRVGGVLQAAGGFVEMWVATALVTVGGPFGGPAIGGGLGIHAGDQIVTGLETAWYGTPQPSQLADMVRDTVQQAGGDSHDAAVAVAIMDTAALVTTVAGGFLGAPEVVAELAGAESAGPVIVGTQRAVLSSASVRGPKLVGFSQSESVMVRDSLKALQDAGYNTGPLKEIIRADMPAGYKAVSLEDGAALGREAFSSQAALNSALEEELLHLNQKAAGLGNWFCRGMAQSLEEAADAARKFPVPK